MKFIYGLNKSGQSIVKYLDNINEKYFCWDDDKKIRNNFSKLKNKNFLVHPDNLNYQMIKEVFVTPGISFKDNCLVLIKKNKIKLFRDLEFYSRLINNQKIIAVTGTNGKSTTTKLIGDILKYNQINTFIGGNIGVPLLDFKTEKNLSNTHVIELSSFQLESCPTFNPYISILLNISPDHLDRYKNYQEYILQKEKIINLNEAGFNIISMDDKECRKIFKKYNKLNLIPISLKPIKNGVYYKDQSIVDDYFEDNQIFKINKISQSLFGLFNIQNILSAYVVNRILGLDLKKFIEVIKSFQGLPHRMERIFNNKEIQVINNSKATNVNATINSINSYSNIFLIIGGRAKEKNFKKINKYKNKISKIYIIGESAKEIFNQVKNEINCEIFKNLENALNKILIDKNKSISFKTVLFSPACTSFDQYDNFESRGKHFKKLINDIIINE